MIKAFSSLWLVLLFTFSNLINAQCTAGEYEAVVTINTVIKGYDISWFLIGPSADTVARGGESPTFYGDNQTYTDTICLTYNTNYSFHAYDATGDGWNGGTYSITRNGQIVINNNGTSPDNFVSNPYDLESTESFTVNTPTNYDLGISEIISPYDGCDLSSNENIIVAVVNNGLLPLDSATIKYIANSGTPVTETFSFNPALASGSFDTLTFNVTADFSSYGAHTISVEIDMSLDSNSSNNIKNLSFNNTQAQYLNLYSDFDNSSIGSSSIIDSIWTSTSNSTSSSQFLWEVGNGQTGSLSTGPSTDASGSGNYIYTEATWGSLGDEATLSTGCISLMGLNEPNLEFYYHRYGSTMGDQVIEVYTNGTWTTIDNITGSQHSSMTDPWTYKNISLLNYANKYIKLRIKGIRGSSYYGDMCLDEINIYNKLGNDIGITKLLSPDNGCALSNNEYISVAVYNNGFLSLDSTTLSFSIDTGSTFSETFTFNPPLAPGTYDTLTFAQSVDASAFGNYSLNILASLGVVDTNQSNNQLIDTFTNEAVLSYNNFLDFDQTPVGTTDSINSIWYVSNSQNSYPYTWQVNSGQTSSLNTGPTSDVSGSGNYIYTEASEGSFGDETYLETACLSLTGLNNPNIDFQYHGYGATMGNLYLEVYDNFQWNIIDSIIGQTHPSMTSAWTYKTIDLSNYSNKTIKVRFRATKGSSYTSDISLDEIFMYNLVSKDAGVSALESPSKGCALSSQETISITVTNWGSDPMSSADISYWVDNGPVITESMNISPAINFGESYTHSFSTTADLSIVGQNYSIGSSITLSGDTVSGNDTMTFSVLNVVPLNTPYSNNFDHIASGVNGAIDADWTTYPTTGYSWETRQPTMTPYGTGAGGDNTTGNGVYLYTEANNGMTGDTAFLESSCIDLSNTNAHVLSFYYHMYGSNMGNLYVEVYHNNMWHVEDSIIGQHQFSSTDSWIEKKVSLTPYSGGTVYIRFRAQRGNGTYSDICLDDISISNIDSIDMALLNVNKPFGGCGLGSSETLNLRVQNLGYTPLSSFQASYTLFGNTVNETINVNPPIGYLETYDFDFATSVDLSTTGLTYNFDFGVSLNGDTVSSNDSITNHTVKNNGVSWTGAYMESFDNIPDGTVGSFNNIWTGDPGTTSNYSWQSNTGQTSSLSTGPSGDHLTGNGIYLYTEASTGVSGQEALLSSTCFSLAGMTQPGLSLWYHKFGSDMGDLYIEIETGGVWTVVDSIIGETHTSFTDPWKNKIVDLQPYINNAFSIRFRGVSAGTYEGDMSIDDLQIFDLPNEEAELVAILSPESKCLSDYNNGYDTISVNIKNNGANPISSIDVTYEFNGGAAINETVSLNPALPSTASTVVYLSNTINVTSAGTQNIKAYISLNGDIDNSNDTISYTFESYSEGGLGFSTNTDYAIPDGDPIGIMIPMIFCGLPQNIDSCFYIKRLSIDSLSHTYLSDLDIYLISPSMDTLELSTDNGGSGSNMFNVHFVNDNGNDITLQTTSIVSDNYLPEEAIGFKKFYGTNPNGAWHLWISDDVGVDDGTLHAASMEFEATPNVDLGEDTTICSWAVIDLNAGGSNGTSYLWQDGSTDSIYIVNAMIMDSTQSHTFSVTVTNNSGCSNSDEIVINIDNCAGIDDINNESSNFSIFPNPAKESFSIEYINENSTECRIKIRNIQGQLIESRQVNSLREGQKVFFNVEDWAEGIYNVNIETDASSTMLRLAIIK